VRLDDLVGIWFLPNLAAVLLAVYLSVKGYPFGRGVGWCCLLATVVLAVYVFWRATA
jgi:hypothetical protein